MANTWKLVSGAVGSFFAWLAVLMGGWDAALALMFLMMGLDVVSGLAVALMKRSDRTQSGGFLSRAFFAGLTRKMMMVLLVILGTALDGLLGTQVCRVSVIGFYAANEAFNVIENAALAGVPFPRGVLMALEKYRQKMDGDGE